MTNDKYQKLIYRASDTKTDQKENKRVIAKIIKMDENNQYENAMTKPLPTDCIKKSKKIQSLREFQLILEGFSHVDKIGHLFIVDSEFDFDRARPKQLLFNEIYTPIFENKKV